MAKFRNIQEWIISEFGQNALKLDNFSSQMQDKYADQINIGKQMHNIEKELSYMQEIYAEAGFTGIDVDASAQKTRITFLDPTGQLDPSACPYIELEASGKDGGLTFHNGMVAYNNPVLMLDSSGKRSGLVSSISLAIRDANEQLRTHMRRINSTNTAEQKVKLINHYVNKAMQGTMQRMAGLYSKKDIEEIQDYEAKRMNSKRAESISSRKNQVDYTRVIDQIFKRAMSTGRLRHGADEKDFTKEFESVIELARSVSSLTELEKALRVNQERNYYMLAVWDEIQAALGPYIADITQGGMTEGYKGKFGLTEPNTPFSFARNTGKKITQNLQIYKQNTNYFNKKISKDPKYKKLRTQAADMTRLHTKAQKADILEQGDDLYKDLYEVAYVTDAHIAAAYQEAKKMFGEGKISSDKFRKIQLQALKGFGEDASFISESLGAEFSKEKELRTFGDVSIDEINKRIVEKITKYIKRKNPINKNRSKEVVDEIVKNATENFNYFELTQEQRNEVVYKKVDRYFQEAMHDLFPNMDWQTGVKGGINKTGFEYTLSDDKKTLTNVRAFRNIDHYSGTGRNGATGDWRTEWTTIDDDFMKMVAEQAGIDTSKTKISILKDASKRLSNKTIQTNINEVVNKILAYAVHENKVRELLNKKKGGLLSHFISLDPEARAKGIMSFLLNEDYAKGYFTGENSKNSIADFLVDLGETATKIGAYSKNPFASVEVGGKKYITTTGAFTGLTEFGNSSSPTYGGMGDLTTSSRKITWREMSALEHTFAEYSRYLLNDLKLSGDTYAEKIKPLETEIDDLHKRFKLNEKGFDSYRRNIKYLSQTFNRDGEEYQKAIAKDETAIILSLQDLIGTDAEIEYNSTDPGHPGKIVTNDNLEFVEFAREKAEDKLKELKEKYNTQDKWKKFISGSGKGLRDIYDKDGNIKKEAEKEVLDELMGRFHVSLGDERLVGSYQGNDLTTSMIALPKIGYNKDFLDKNKILSLDEGGLAAYRIINSLQDIDSYINRDEGKNLAFYALTRAYEDYYDAVNRGSIWESFFTLKDDPSSGRLKTLGFSDNKQVLSDLLSQTTHYQQLNDEEKKKALETVSGINMIMNTADFRAMLEEEQKTDKGKNVIDRLYERFYDKKEIKGHEIKKSDYKSKISKIIKALDISGDEWKGQTLDDMAWNRDPTINFLNDVMGGRLVLSSDSKLLGKNHLMINKNLLAVGHGDMDGDLVSMYYFFKTGDTANFEKAWKGFQDSVIINQKKIDDEDKKEDAELKKEIAQKLNLNDPNSIMVGEVDKINSVQDLKGKRLTVGAMWNAKKGAGIYGDLVFAQERIGSALKNLDRNDSVNGAKAMGAAAFQALTQTLYQEGINVKNASKLAESVGVALKPGEVIDNGTKAGLVQLQIDSMFEMLNQSATFDDASRLRAFINKGETLGAFDVENGQMFKDNTLSTLGLDKLLKTGRENLLKVAQKHLKKLQAEKNTKAELDLQKDINKLKKADNNPITNFGREMTIALIMELGEEVRKDPRFGGKTLGQIMTDKYLDHIIPGRGVSGLEKLNRASGPEVYDEITKKYMNEDGTFKKGNASFLENTAIGKYLQMRKAELADFFTPATTTQSHRLLYNMGKGAFDVSKLPLAGNIVKAALESPELLKTTYANAMSDKEAVNIAKGLLGGSIAHQVSEHYGNLMQEGKTDEREKYLKWFGTTRGLGKGKDQSSKYLTENDINLRKQVLALFGKGHTKEAGDFLEKAIYSGRSNADYLANYHSTNGGEVIAREALLTGFGSIVNGKVAPTRQIADVISKVGNTIMVGDWKNYSGGQVPLDALLQVKDYVESLRILQQAMRDTKATGADFLYENNSVAKGWQERLFDDITDKETKVINAKAKEERIKSFEKIFNAIAQGGDITNFGGEILLRDSTSGLLKHAKIKVDEQSLVDLYNRMKATGKTLEDMIDIHGPEAAAIIQQSLVFENEQFLGTSEQEKEAYGPLFDKLMKEYEKIAGLKVKLYKIVSQLDSLNKQDPEMMDEKIQQKIAALNSERERLEEEKKGVVAGYENLKKEIYKQVPNGMTREAGRVIKKDVQGMEKSIDETAEQTINADKELEENKLLASDVTGYYKKIEEVYAAFYDAEQKGLTDEAKIRRLFDFRKRAKNLDVIRDRVRDVLKKRNSYKEVMDENGKQTRIWQNVNGEPLSEEEQKKFEEYYGPILDGAFALDKEGKWTPTSSFDEQRKNAERERSIRAHSEQIKFRQGYESYYKGILKLENDISEQKERQRELEEKGTEESKKEAELLGYQIETEEKYLAAQNDLSYKWKDSEYASPEEMAKIQEVVKLQLELEKMRRKPQNGGGQGGSGGGFLGIDSATTRWIQRMMNGGAIYAFIRMLRKGFHDITNMAKQLDQAMTNLRIVTGKNAEDARTLVSQYAKLGKELGATTVEITQSATSWLRQGYEIAEVNDLITASMYLSKLGMIDTGTAVQNLTSAMHGFKLEASNAMDIVDKFTALDVKAATTAGDIAQGLSQFANIAKLGGVSIDQAAAYVATIADVNQMSGITVGQSLNFYGDLRG